MKAQLRVWILAAVAAGAAVIVWCSYSQHFYEANCEFAFSNWEILTNELNHVARPTRQEWNGPYFGSKFIVNNRIKEFLSGRIGLKPLVNGYFDLHPECSPRAIIVSNAFASINYEIGGRDEVAVVKLIVRSDDRDVALGVVEYVMDRFAISIDSENQQREGKALAQLQSNILCARRKNQDVTELQKSLEVARRICERYNLKVLPLTRPSVKWKGNLL